MSGAGKLLREQVELQQNMREFHQYLGEKSITVNLIDSLPRS